MTCVPSRDSGVCCPHEEVLGPKLSIKRTEKALIRLDKCPGCSESTLDAQVILLVLSCSLVLSCGGLYNFLVM